MKVTWRTIREGTERLERGIYGRRMTDSLGRPHDGLAVGMEVLLDLSTCGYAHEEPGEFWYEVLYVGDTSREWPYLQCDFRARLGGPGDCGGGGQFRLEHIRGIRQPPERWQAADGTSWRYFPKDRKWYGWIPDAGHIRLRDEDDFRSLYPGAPAADEAGRW